VFQNAAAQAKAAVVVLGKIRSGEEVPEKTIVPFEPITKDNVADYMK
jgi:inositol transport system substrate-binding protein